ncbi:tumor susceptibility protein [Ophiocordyceps sinensis CO18]|nr:tumor susceptibility protein [Ophiocordyceps sinensis CO18]
MPSRYEFAPPLPPEAQAPRPLGQHHPHSESHVPLQQHMSHDATSSHTNARMVHQSQHPTQWPPHAAVHPSLGQWQPQGPPPSWNGAAAVEHQQPPPPPPPQAPAQPNILDEPLTLQVPAHSAMTAPPIPPNPEKDALLRQLAQTLASMRRRSRQQNESSMAGLKAQRMAMQDAAPALQSEMSQLTQLSNLLVSNTHILHEALHKADGVIEGSKNHPAPDVDNLLVAPTVVSNQLYTLVAEERALGDAIFMLGRAVERGRISPAVFAKMTRSLAREWYLKKALVNKIGVGMGISLA